MFERIDLLVTNCGFSFQAWDDRYCKGVWAALGTWDEEVDTVRDLSSAGDLDMIPAMEYVFSTDWLPYVTGRTLHEAMVALETLLASLPSDQLDRASDWATMVNAAIRHLQDEYHGAKESGDIDGKLQTLPQTFGEAVQSFLPACQT